MERLEKEKNLLIEYQRTMHEQIIRLKNEKECAYKGSYGIRLGWYSQWNENQNEEMKQSMEKIEMLEEKNNQQQQKQIESLEKEKSPEN